MLLLRARCTLGIAVKPTTTGSWKMCMWCQGRGKAPPSSAATEPREVNGTNMTRELFRTIEDAAVRESAANSWPWTLASGVIVGGHNIRTSKRSTPVGASEARETQWPGRGAGSRGQLAMNDMTNSISHWPACLYLARRG